MKLKKKIHILNLDCHELEANDELRWTISMDITGLHQGQVVTIIITFLKKTLSHVRAVQLKAHFTIIMTSAHTTNN
jgi:hypothetical protein